MPVTNNNIPFENIDPTKAKEAPQSDYMVMMLALKGIVVLWKATGEKMSRWELYERYRYSKNHLKKISKLKHPKLLFLKELTDEQRPS